MARKARIPAHILNEARELMAKGHSLLNTRRLLSIRHKTEFSYYVLLYWLNDDYRQRKLARVRKETDNGNDARGQGEASDNEASE